MINKSGSKISMDIYKKPTNLKRYFPFTSNLPRRCLANILFSLARRMCKFVENENLKEKRFKGLKKNIARTKIQIVANRS